ncbi:MAG: phage tail protein, partial [Flavobacteriales bacterium]|nr:phage tail protein [Flavobacteriales bacterium]
DNTGTGNAMAYLANATSTGNANYGFAESGTNTGSIGWDVSGNYIGIANLNYSTSQFAMRLNADGSFTFHDGATGTQMFEIEADGDVGIGTTAPALLSGSTDRIVEIESSNNPGLALHNSSAGGRQYFLYSHVTGGVGSLRIYDATSGADRWTLNNNGNVGLGTTTPAEHMHLASSANSTDLKIQFTSPNAASATRHGWLYFDPDDNIVGFENGASPFRVGLNSSGALNLTEMSSTTAKSGYGQIYVKTDNELYFMDESGNETQLTSSGASGSGWTDAGSEVYTTTSTDKVGIGLTNPSVMLHIDGGTGLSDLANDKGDLVIGDVSSTNLVFDANEIQGRSNGSAADIFLQKNGGNIGVGTNGPETNFHVLASGTAGTPSITSTSVAVFQNSSATTTQSYVGIVAGNASTNSGIRFGDTDDHDIGGVFYSHDDNHLSFRTNNSNDQVTINSSGDMGIGTDNPQTDFHVLAGGTAGTPAVTGTSVGVFQSTGGTTSQAYVGVIAGNNSANSGIRFGDTDDHDIGGVFYSHDDDHLSFRTNNTNNRLVLMSDGNVGIGTDAPEHDLHLADNSDNTVIRVMAHSNTANHRGVLQLGHTRGTAASQTVVQNGDLLGNVSFVGHTGSGLATSANITVEASGDWGVNDEPGDMTFTTTPDGSGTGAERMRITHDGNVGVGTTSPSSILEVHGTQTFSHSTHSGSFTAGMVSNNTWRLTSSLSGAMMTCGPGNTINFGSQQLQANVRGIVLSNTTGGYALTTNVGNVGIATATPAEQLHVEGSIRMVDGNQTDGDVMVSDANGTASWQPVGVPTGAVMPYAAAAAPTGWLLCDGSAVSRTTYANLFALIGTTYGAGDGSTTFNVPDMQGRVPVGSGNGVYKNGGIAHSTSDPLTSRTLGTYDGAEYPSGQPLGGSASSPAGAGNYIGAITGADIIFHGTSSGANMAGNTEGGNMQPFLVLNYIIKH